MMLLMFSLRCNKIFDLTVVLLLLLLLLVAAAFRFGSKAQEKKNVHTIESSRSHVRLDQLTIFVMSLVKKMCALNGTNVPLFFSLFPFFFFLHLKAP